jgi:crotonobetainyl-CoA:carnitine CoA-transferase CaiB-like acyl-CoA transferase
VYELKDGYAVIALSGTMDDFAEAIGSEALAAFDHLDRRRRRAEFTTILAELLRGWTYQQLDETLTPRGFWIERVAGYDDVRQDPQVVAEGLLGQIPVRGETATVLNHPVRYDGELPGLRTPPAELGEHTRSVLGEVGFSTAEIDAFISSGAVVAGDREPVAR